MPITLRAKLARVLLSGAALTLWSVIAIGILFVGLRFLIAPATGAEGFGVPILRSDAYAYLLAAKGIRDVVSGLLVIALLAMGCPRRMLGAFILIATLIPVGDFFTVLAYAGPTAVIPLIIHGGTAVLMIVIGTALLLKVGSEPHRISGLARRAIDLG